MSVSPVLFTTQRLIVRGLAADDLPSFAANRALPEIARYQSWSTKYTLADAESLLARQSATPFGAVGSWHQLALEDSESAAFVGDLAVHFVDDAQAEIGFTLVRAHQGKGLGREAVRGLLLHLFGTMGKRRVTARTDAANGASAALLLAVGMRQEGCLKESELFKGEWCGELLFAVLAGEFRGDADAVRISGAATEPALRTDRLDLRPLTPDDWGLWRGLYSNEEVLRFVGERSDADVLSSFTSRLICVDSPWSKESGRPLTWVMVERASGATMGVIGLLRMEWEPTRISEVGFLLMPEFHGKGYAKEALKAATRFGILDCGFKKLHAVASGGNVACRALLKSAGFVEEGIRRQHFCCRGEWHDDVLYGMLKEDFDLQMSAP